ncbi:flagellar biosynthetic protein FliO [Congregibacter litoralis]|uniref:Flagellar protein n=1 Tax=Congregibacter litoralis KT71 TaxID=314285 RepID=A4A5Y7_9GAMM|nr:flagellar biosynthetic protein FliO [Congregibacter litoralis]EAQ98434.2 flagellar biosynthetic protein FliO [Congregibacter litoralis KT71]
MKTLRSPLPVLLMPLIASRSLAQEKVQETAQEAVGIAKTGSSPELFSAGYLFQVLGSLVLVFVCLFAVVYFLKRFNGTVGTSGSALRVLGSASVGQREKVVLMEVGGEQLLIGVAPGSVRKLHVLPEALVTEEATQTPTPDFAAVLRAANPLGSKS